MLTVPFAEVDGLIWRKKRAHSLETVAVYHLHKVQTRVIYSLGDRGELYHTQDLKAKYRLQSQWRQQYFRPA